MWNCNNPYAVRDATLRRMGFSSYRDYTRSATWKAIRARVIQRANGRCERCQSRRRIQVHHRAYDAATLTGANLNSLTTLCAHCHCAAERPLDTTRDRYDRLIAASAFAVETTPDWAERCRIWQAKHRAVFPMATNDPRHAETIVARIRGRATDPAGSHRCLVCGRKDRNPIVEPKIAGAYTFCGSHRWSDIRACLDALALGGTNAAAA